jgi:hypothetical protein
MTDQGGIPSLWLEFDKHGASDPGTAGQLTALLDKPGVEDLVVMSHGWKNDKKDAAELYGTLWANARTNFPPGGAELVVVAGLLWPAKAFRTDFDEAALAQVNAGGALGAASGRTVIDLSEQDFEALQSKPHITSQCNRPIDVANASLFSGLPASKTQPKTGRSGNIDHPCPSVEVFRRTRGLSSFCRW